MVGDDAPTLLPPPPALEHLTTYDGFEERAGGCRSTAPDFDLLDLPAEANFSLAMPDLERIVTHDGFEERMAAGGLADGPLARASASTCAATLRPATSGAAADFDLQDLAAGEPAGFAFPMPDLERIVTNDGFEDALGRRGSHPPPPPQLPPPPPGIDGPGVVQAGGSPLSPLASADDGSVQDGSPLCLAGEPAFVRVRHTFLDVASAPPQLLRARTEPGGASAAAARLGSTSDDEAAEPAPAPAPAAAPPPAPAPLTLEKFTTPDWLENPQDGTAADQQIALGAKVQSSLGFGGAGPLFSAPAGFASAAGVCASLPPALSPPPALPPPPSYWAPCGLPAAREPPPPPPGVAATKVWLSCEGAPKAAGLLSTRDATTGATRVFWAVDSRKLDSQDKQAVSPDFLLPVPGDDGPQPFRMLLRPTPKNDGRRGSGFKKSKGRGRVELKCEVPRPSGAGAIVFRIAVGRGPLQQPARDPVSYNFADNGSCCTLAKAQEEWDLRAAVDDTKTFLVVLEVEACN
eukprot:TRINITY_DN21134_c0_g1_i1.p1 TRINITY_DN21134_c0_g1~~TRINITY_DN21134_c0_g1_i1.p1  ORF type:complete len:556 (-),score=145.54 TRINITY_DN21134_c0_g1_i1:83-1639(-)